MNNHPALKKYSNITTQKRKNTILPLQLQKIKIIRNSVEHKSMVCFDCIPARKSTKDKILINTICNSSLRKYKNATKYTVYKRVRK